MPMKQHFSFFPSDPSSTYRHVELTYAPGFKKAGKECTNRGQQLALYMSLVEYTQLVAQAPPSVPYNAFAVRYTALQKRLEWILPAIQMQRTPLNHLTPPTDGSGSCYFPEKVTTTTPHSLKFKRGRCTTVGKGVCMPIPKIAGQDVGCLLGKLIILICSLVLRWAL